MNAKDTFLAANAHVDEAAIQPLPNSRKVYIEGSRPDIQVPMREISQADTPTGMGGEQNPPIFVYDCSGIYSDPAAKIDISSGLPALRAQWIAERGDTEELTDLSDARFLSTCIAIKSTLHFDRLNFSLALVFQYLASRIITWCAHDSTTWVSS